MPKHSHFTEESVKILSINVDKIAIAVALFGISGLPDIDAGCVVSKLTNQGNPHYLDLSNESRVVLLLHLTFKEFSKKNHVEFQVLNEQEDLQLKTPSLKWPP